MKTATTTAVQLEEAGRRLDASYHASDGVRAHHFIREWAGQTARRQAIAKGTTKERVSTYSKRRLDTLAEVSMPDGLFIPGRFKRIYVDDLAHGAPYLTGGSIMQADPLAGAKLLSYRFTSNMDELALHERMILITCSGTIGNCVYLNANLEGSVGSPDLVRIIANPKEILSGYLYAWLSSPLGRTLIEQKTYGAVVPHIESHHVVDLPIPRLDVATEQRIHELIERTALLRVEANQLLTNAQSRLFQTIGLPRLSSQESLTKGHWTFTAQRGDLKQTTLTAWTYNPVTQRLMRAIRTHPYKPLGEIVIPGGIFRGPRFKRIEADQTAGIVLLSQADVFQLRPQGRWISKTAIPNYAECTVRDGTILVAAQGTMGDNELFGHCQFAHRNFGDAIITEHIMRIIPDTQKVNSGYLFAFLSSEYGFQLLRSTEFGTKLLGFSRTIVSDLPIPLLPEVMQREIGGMVCRAYERRAEAVDLEDQAQILLTKALTTESAP